MASALDPLWKLMLDDRSTRTEESTASTKVVRFDMSKVTVHCVGGIPFGGVSRCSETSSEDRYDRHEFSSGEFDEVDIRDDDTYDDSWSFLNQPVEEVIVPVVETPPSFRRMKIKFRKDKEKDNYNHRAMFRRDDSSATRDERRQGSQLGQLQGEISRSEAAKPKGLVSILRRKEANPTNQTEDQRRASVSSIKKVSRAAMEKVERQGSCFATTPHDNPDRPIIVPDEENRQEHAVTASLNRATAVMMGIAMAGVTSTAELFDTSQFPVKKCRGVHLEDETDDFWDDFNSIGSSNYESESCSQSYSMASSKEGMSTEGGSLSLTLGESTLESGSEIIVHEDDISNGNSEGKGIPAHVIPVSHGTVYSANEAGEIALLRNEDSRGGHHTAVGEQGGVIPVAGEGDKDKGIFKVTRAIRACTVRLRDHDHEERIMGFSEWDQEPANGSTTDSGVQYRAAGVTAAPLEEEEEEEGDDISEREVFDRFAPEIDSSSTNDSESDGSRHFDDTSTPETSDRGALAQSPFDDGVINMEASYDIYGSPRDVIRVVETDLLRHDDYDTTVKIEASTISYSDCRIRQGKWWGDFPIELPSAPGVDFVGQIQEIGRRASVRYGLCAGDRVASLVRSGGNARFMNAKASQLVKVLDGLDPADAVCLNETYLSAFQALHCGQRQMVRYKKRALESKAILVLGGMTNVGKAVIELAVQAGATFIYAPCKNKHKEKVKKMRATPLGLKKDEWMHIFYHKIDIIIDATIDMSEDHQVDNFYSALSENGHYILVGRTESEVDKIVSKWVGTTKIGVCTNGKVKMMMKVHSYDVFSKWESCLDTCKRDLSHLMKLLLAGKIAPHVLDLIPLHKVAKAQVILDSKRLQGHLICEPWMSGSKTGYL